MSEAFLIRQAITSKCHSLAKGLVHEVCVVDLNDALILLEQSLLPRATLLLHSTDVQTKRPIRTVCKERKGGYLLFKLYVYITAKFVKPFTYVCKTQVISVVT